MCTWIVEKSLISGSGKGSQGWFPLRQANVYFDHPQNAPLDEALMIDFVNADGGPGARVAVELSAESAVELTRLIHAALERGKDHHGVPAAPGGTGSGAA